MRALECLLFSIVLIVFVTSLIVIVMAIDSGEEDFYMTWAA